MSINVLKLREKDISNKIIWIIFIVLSIFLLAFSIASGKIIYSCAIVVPLFIYLCIKNPFIFPFGAYAFLLPFDSVLSITGSDKGTTLTKFLGILSMLTLLLKGIFEKKLKRPNNAVTWWIVMIIYAFLSIFWTVDPDKTFSRFLTATGLLALYLIASSYKINENEFNTFKWLIMLGGLLAVLFAIYNYKTGIFYIDMRTTIEFGGRTTNPNAFAFSLIIPVAVCIGQILSQKKTVRKVILGIALGLLIFGIIVTGSRGGLVGVGIVSIVYVLSMKKRVTLLTIFLCIGILSLSFMPDFFVERWEQAIETGGSGRTTIWYHGLRAFKEYWLFGAGLDNFPLVYTEFGHFTPFSKLYRASHNLYLRVLVELGFVGFFLLFWAMVRHYRIIKPYLMRYNGDMVMLKASCWGILLTSFFSDTLWTKSFWLLWTLILMNRNIGESFQTNLSASFTLKR